MAEFTPINVSPFATNVLDLIDKELITRDGKIVSVRHYTGGFVIYVNGERRAEADSNVQASYVLNQLEVGLK